MDIKNRPPKAPPILERDEHNQVKDPNQATRLNNELLAKLATETREVEKENSFHVSKTGRRDVVIHLAVTILPRVDGRTIIGEKEREMGQWCSVIPAKLLPVHKGTGVKALTELFQFGKQALMKMGVWIEK